MNVKKIFRSAAKTVGSAAGFVSSAVGRVLSASHSKKELIDLRRRRWVNVTGQEEKRMNRMKSGLENYRNTPKAVLLDVREKDDFEEGHIPGAEHADLNTLQFYHAAKDTPIFVYCYRGTRSALAAEILRRAGFEEVRDLGGIDWYTGPVESE